jgi:hypothetical protein
MEVKMKKFPTIAVAPGLLLSVTAGAQNNRIPETMKKIEPLPRDLEIQLALSALPPHLREHATVYDPNWSGGFRGRWGPSVAHDLLSVRAHTPVTRCSLRLATRAGRSVGGDHISPPASLKGPEI